MAYYYKVKLLSENNRGNEYDLTRVDYKIVDTEGGNVFSGNTGETNTISYSTDNESATLEITLSKEGYVSVSYECGVGDDPDDWDEHYLNESAFYYPAWRDIYYTFPTSPATYNVISGLDTIYSGKAVTEPGESKPKINISSIVRDHIGCNDMTFGNTGTIVRNGEDKSFLIDYGSTTEPTTYYYFHNDWSYDTTINYNTTSGNGIILSNPINGHFDYRQYFLFTGYQSGSHPQNWSATVNDSNGASISSYSPELGVIYKTSTFEISGVPTNAASVYFSNPESEESIGYTKKVCARYVLYYRNRKGGFDSFVIEGKATKTDSYDRGTYNTVFNNNNLTDYGKKNYHKDITTQWSLNTGWLNDEEAEKFAFNLIPSPQIYFHDLETGEIKAAIITDSSAEYKTFLPSRKMISYSLTMEESQTKLFN